MKKELGNYWYSPSDLTLFMDSPFASWMARLAVESPDDLPEKDDVDPLMELLQQRGYAHEDALEAKFVSEGKSVVKIEVGTHEDKWQATIDAMRGGVDVIVQGRLVQKPFAGFADFLVKTAGASDLGDYHYEVWDTKLSSTLKANFVVQLCCYAEMLESIQGVRPAYITVALGNDQTEALKTNDYFYYYQDLKQRFLREQVRFDANQMPDPAESKTHGAWSSFAEKTLLDRDHLSQVASITRGQIKRLNAAGIETLQQLVESERDSVPGIAPALYRRLASQAAIQFASRGKDVPEFELIMPLSGEKLGLGFLPPGSSKDVYFDIEGFPLDKGGLEYLWGCAYFDENGDRQFKDFWAHDRDQEKQAFKEFVSWVYERWQSDQHMHIYHYANYEIAACQKMMQREGVCEYEVDQLLRNEVFIDLYKIVKGSILLGEPRYSIKNVEHLYRGKRDTNVSHGGDSIVVYEQWREMHAQGKQGATWETSEILKDVRDYNIDDCNSTQELVDWLRQQQQKAGIEFLGKTEVVEFEVKDEIIERNQLRDRLLERAEAERSIDVAQAAISENLAYALEFHRREAKPVFWKLFERLGMEETELLDDLDCLATCQRTDREPYQIKRSQGYEYNFDANQEFKATGSSYYVLGEEKENGQPLEVNIEKGDSDFANGLFVVKAAKDAPPAFMNLIPNEYVRPEPIPTALAGVVHSYEKGLLGQCALVDFLARGTPRISGHEAGQPIAESQDAEENLQKIIKAIINLEKSYLPIQGPPGSGKTYTGSHVIAELMKQKKRVGICSNSHKAINNLLISTAECCAEKSIHADFMCTKETDLGMEDLGIAIGKNPGLAGFLGKGDACVVGTTAWGFARDDMASQLDYLFIDEAGQVSVANLIAISRSASNLVLMGDQMQLGQPTQAKHPADSGLSVLEYLLHENPTIESAKGVFLGTTYRMHSAVNRFISETVYEGKLHSDPANDDRVIAVPENYRGRIDKEAGILFVPVEHEGNTQASDEEIAEIVSITQELMGRIFTDKDGTQHGIGWADILYVAPYNFQVNKLGEDLVRLPGGERARVGTVDKFQGQEAPVVILSMCTSDASESPRGIDFLFDKNRLNVAISRAQSLAIVVANPALTSTTVNSPDQMAKVNMFASIQHFV
ncbi:TM0106 family RecB-like putative nuclease [Pseudomonadota bacterium]